jgi:DNA repair protein RadA/Sms
VEVQALVGRPGPAVPRRVATGIDARRLAVILAVLETRARIDLATSDVFVNVAGGFRVHEPAADLAVALAVASSRTGRAVDPRLVAVGEVGLGGEVRRVSHLDRRLREAAQLGFAAAVIPAGAQSPGEAGLRVLCVSHVEEAIRKVGEVRS